MVWPVFKTFQLLQIPWKLTTINHTSKYRTHSAQIRRTCHKCPLLTIFGEITSVERPKMRSFRPQFTDKMWRNLQSERQKQSPCGSKFTLKLTVNLICRSRSQMFCKEWILQKRSSEKINVFRPCHNHSIVCFYFLICATNHFRNFNEFCFVCYMDTICYQI